ncbi:hypothetical protein [Streptomyces sp. MI02-7b]|uniref:hypothetical protein n=1 Tax=Streptomyces sp. MI02-7b TaxID=462941 RepID=UPI0029BA7C58|nr:hypothetical protein [Streptomyces sp. MI02-7b]MDX3075386.1 hypothetical protein [Streptomyces sp. MI02-7b]
MTESKRPWGRSADGPWWRFVPRNRWTGVLGLVAGILLVVQMMIVLVDRSSAGQTVFGVFLGLVGIALIVSGVDGLRVLNRHESR